jgi:formate/nitrite transporter FocA (FNT family)
MEKQATVGGMIKNLTVVFIGNLVGAVLVAALVVYGHTLSLFGNAAAVNAIHTAVLKVNITWMDAFIRGILCNFLVVCVWMAFAAKDVVRKIAGLYLPILPSFLPVLSLTSSNM